MRPVIMYYQVYTIVTILLSLLPSIFSYYHWIIVEHSISQLYKNPMKIIFCWIEHPATFIRKLKTLRVLKCNPILFFYVPIIIATLTFKSYACEIVRLLYRFTFPQMYMSTSTLLPSFLSVGTILFMLDQKML